MDPVPSSSQPSSSRRKLSATSRTRAAAERASESAAAKTIKQEDSPAPAAVTATSPVLAAAGTYTAVIHPPTPQLTTSPSLGVSSPRGGLSEPRQPRSNVGDEDFAELVNDILNGSSSCLPTPENTPLLDLYAASPYARAQVGTHLFASPLVERQLSTDSIGTCVQFPQPMFMDASAMIDGLMLELAVADLVFQNTVMKQQQQTSTSARPSLSREADLRPLPPVAPCYTFHYTFHHPAAMQEMYSSMPFGV